MATDLSAFPPETTNGEIKIKDGKITCKGRSSSINDCVVNIPDIQFIYLYHNDAYLYLYIFDYHQNYLPASYAGFRQVYQELSSLFDLEDNNFIKNTPLNRPFKKQLWRKKMAVNFKILEKDYNDYLEGFEVQSPQKLFVSWDTTYDQLKTNEHVTCTTLASGQTQLAFKYPVRLGNLVIQTWSTYLFNGRTDVAVLDYNAHCFNSDSNHQSYLDILARFNSDFGLDKSAGSYNRDDQKATYFHLDGISLSIVYWEDSDWCFNAGYTSLTVENKKVYPDLLADTNYENTMEVTDFILLEGPYGIYCDYKRDPLVKRRQPLLRDRFENKSVIWTDKKNRKIGFASQDFSQVYDESEIESFQIGNLLPAKGRGNAHLFLKLRNQNDTKPIMAGNCKAFDGFAEGIKKLTGLPLSFLPEDYDC